MEELKKKGNSNNVISLQSEINRIICYRDQQMIKISSFGYRSGREYIETKKIKVTKIVKN